MERQFVKTLRLIHLNGPFFVLVFSCISHDAAVFVASISLPRITKYPSCSYGRVEVILDSDLLDGVISKCFLNHNRVGADE